MLRSSSGPVDSALALALGEASGLVVSGAAPFPTGELASPRKPKYRNRTVGLKRYVARELYRVLISGASSPLPMGS
jgi:hypothetical protein